jgi:hypothetical protein
MDSLINPFTFILPSQTDTLSVAQKEFRKGFENLYDRFSQFVQKTIESYHQRKLSSFGEYQEALEAVFKESRLQEAQQEYVVNLQLAMKNKNLSLWLATQQQYISTLNERNRLIQQRAEESLRHYFEVTQQIYVDTEKQLRDAYFQYLQQLLDHWLKSRPSELDIPINFAVGLSIAMGAYYMLPPTK